MKTRYLCLAIFLLSFGIRAVELWQLPESDLMFSPDPPEAMRSWDEGINTAYSLVTGKGYSNPFLAAPSGPSAHVAPAFPAEMAAIFSVFGTGRHGAIARNVFLMAGYSLLFALLPLFARGLGMSPVAGGVAGFASALYPIYGSVTWYKARDEWLAAIGAMLLLLYGLRLARAERLTPSSALLYGAGWGALMYVLPSMAPILPVHLVIILLIRKRDRDRILFSTLVATAFLLVVLPWTIRNRMVMGGWFFMRDDAGLELEVANGDGATPSFIGNGRAGWFCEVHPDCNEAVARRIGEVGELEFNREAGARTISWIESHPSRFAGLTARRIFEFWFGLRYEPVSFGLKLLCWPLAVVGLVLMWRAGLRLETAMLGTLWLVYPLVYYLIQYTDRYPVAISPAILLPAGYAVVKLYSNPRTRRTN